MLKNIKIKMPSSFSFVLSVAFHALVVVFFSVKIKEQSKSQFVFSEIDQIKNKAQATQLESVKLISKRELETIKEKQMLQIVASQKNNKNEKPEATRFLGESSNSVDRQTIARNHGSFKAAGQGKKEGVIGATGSTVPALAKSKEKKKKLSLSDLGGFRPRDVQEIEENFDKITQSIAQGLESGDITKSGLAANNDHVEDVSLGDMTSLNTQEYKYYGFYQRIRQQLEQHWGGTIKDKARNIYRSGGRVPANESLITSVSVTINSLGKIIDMKIEGSSGIRELDQAAIESFNKAGPFPNPPKGLLVGGRATIQWGFVVKG